MKNKTTKGGAGKGGAGRSDTAGGGSGVGAGGQRLMHVKLKTARQRKHSSQLWLERQLNDPYVQAAKREGFRSRAAYKLQEMDDKYHILKPGMCVVDLGAAPGGWSQIAAERVKSNAAERVKSNVAERAKSVDGGAEKRGQVVAIDYLGIEPIAGVEIIEMDFTAETAEQTLKDHLRAGSAHVVLSDMAAPTVGHASTDHLRIMGLAEMAAHFAADILTPGGTFVCKVLQGGTERDLLDFLKKNFATVRHVKPPASRSDSAELYVVATGFRGGERLIGMPPSCRVTI